MKDSLKNKLKINYEESSHQVPNDLWKRIEVELDENINERKLQLFNYKWLSLAAVFLLFISLGFIYYFNFKSKPEQTKTANLAAKILEPTIKNSSENSINDRNLSRVEPVSQQPQNDKMRVKIVKISNEKYLNKKNIESNIIEVKSANSQLITEEVNLEKSAMPIAKKEVKENLKYTSAKDLLFGYELKKTNSELEKSHSKLGINEIKAPKEITILGIKIYSDESSNK